MINKLMALLLEELREGGIPDPLTESFTFAALWDDLARLAGETPPAIVRQFYEADCPDRPSEPGRAPDRNLVRVAALVIPVTRAPGNVEEGTRGAIVVDTQGGREGARPEPVLRLRTAGERGAALDHHRTHATHPAPRPGSVHRGV